MNCRVSPGRLAVVRPGETYECDVPVLAEFRGSETLDLLLWPWTFTVAAPSPVPVLRFDATRVM